MGTGSFSGEILVRRYFDVINAELWDELSCVFAQDAEVRAVGVEPMIGLPSIKRFYSRLFAAWATHFDQPTRMLPSGDSIAVEVRFVGTTHDGRVLEFDAVDVIDLAGDRIGRLTNWYDIAKVRTMLSPAGETSPRR
ncbi:MAG TPA: nuclear transport factor 2 family protein [Ilumatobacter sp.]|nr:nuclear transport factor 2 family protein [Ilumatobacter sp.]